jgi:hypothetical protein
MIDIYLWLEKTVSIVVIWEPWTLITRLLVFETWHLHTSLISHLTDDVIMEARFELSEMYASVSEQ